MRRWRRGRIARLSSLLLLPRSSHACTGSKNGMHNPSGLQPHRRERWARCCTSSSRPTTTTLRLGLSGGLKFAKVRRRLAPTCARFPIPASVGTSWTMAAACGSRSTTSVWSRCLATCSRGRSAEAGAARATLEHVALHGTASGSASQGKPSHPARHLAAHRLLWRQRGYVRSPRLATLRPFCPTP